MSDKISFLDLSKKILFESNKPMTSEEIWDYAKENGYDSRVGTKGKTPWRTIGAQLYVNIRDKGNSPFIKIDSKPRKFFLKELVDKNAIQELIEKEVEKVEETETVTY